MSEVWHFYVGFRSLLQKNCAIWTIPKGNGLWIVPCPLFFLCRQTAQSKPKTKNYIINVVANHYIRSFVMWSFISSPLYTILADLRSFLESKKESGEPDSRAGARSLQRPYFLSAKRASCPEVFLCNRSTFLLHKKADLHGPFGSTEISFTFLSGNVSHCCGFPSPQLLPPSTAT
mgnify:CR=1 FL=1